MYCEFCSKLLTDEEINCGVCDFCGGEIKDNI